MRTSSGFCLSCSYMAKYLYILGADSATARSEALKSSEQASYAIFVAIITLIVSVFISVYHS